MNKDIVLVSPPPGWQRTLPIGLGFLASYLSKSGFSAVIYDMALDMIGKVKDEDRDCLWGLKAKNLWLDPEVFKLFVTKYEKEIQSCVDHILSFSSSIIGFSVIHSKQLVTLEIIRRIKKIDPSITIIVGGPACFYDEDRYILEAPKIIDIFVLGEGEKTLYECLVNIKQNKPLDEIKGVRTLESNYKGYISRDPIEDLDTIPFPEYPGLKIEDYQPDPVPLFCSRGCFGKCSFCEIKNIWKSYRTRSAESIFEEIKFYVEKKEIFHFSLFDSIVNGDPKNLERLCDFVIKSMYKIRWEGNVLALPSMNRDIYSKMQKAGCELVYFGVETGSEYVCKKMKKPFTIFEAERNIRLAHEAGIEVSVNFITGFPGEDEEHFQQTIDFTKRNSQYIDRVDFITECQVARGTHLFLHPADYGIVIPEDWQGYKWYTNDEKNTISVRQARTLILGKYLDSLGVKINVNFNLDDGSQKVKGKIVVNLKKDINKGTL
ncbi:MAG: radical SAM protein [Candidatus Omnitrophica bacterium]|nr:radical SAM protein [Candidatus Omnitrophota bacterium]